MIDKGVFNMSMKIEILDKIPVRSILINFHSDLK